MQFYYNKVAKTFSYYISPIINKIVKNSLQFRNISTQNSLNHPETTIILIS